MHGIGQARGMYVGDNEDWLPGMQGQAEAGFDYQWYPYYAYVSDIGVGVPLGGTLIYAVTNAGVAVPVGIGGVNSYVQGKQFYCPGTEGVFNRLPGAAPYTDPNGLWYYPWEGPSLYQTYVANFGQPNGQGTWAVGTPSQQTGQQPIVVSSYFYRSGQYYPEASYQANIQNPFAGADAGSILMASSTLVHGRPYLVCFSPATYRYKALNNPPSYTTTTNPGFFAHRGRWENLAMDDGSAKTYVIPSGLAPLTDWQDGGAFEGPSGSTNAYTNTPGYYITSYGYWSNQMPYYWTYLDHPDRAYP
jgi:hypothetical protein